MSPANRPVPFCAPVADSIKRLTSDMKAKKKSSGKPSNSSRIPADELQELMVRSFGDNACVRASDAVSLDISYFSTGAYGLDFELGGGWPRNRVIEVYGPESAGKSTLTMISTAAFHRQFSEGHAWVVDFERTHTVEYASRFGVDLDRLHILSPDYGEQGVDMCMMICEQAEEETLLIVDSIAMMTPSKELEDEAVKSQPGAHARLVHKFMRGFSARTRVSMFDNSAPCLTAICINQIREKVGVMFGSNETTTGGRGMRYTPSVRVRIAANKSGYQGKTITSGGVKKEVQTGQITEFSVHKNKAGGGKGVKGEFLLRYNPIAGSPEAVDNSDALIQYGLYYEVLDQISARKFRYPTYDIEGDKATLAQYFEEQPEIATDLRDEIVTSMRELRKTGFQSAGIEDVAEYSEERTAIEFV